MLSLLTQAPRPPASRSTMHVLCVSERAHCNLPIFYGVRNAAAVAVDSSSILYSDGHSPSGRRRKALHTVKTQNTVQLKKGRRGGGGYHKNHDVVCSTQLREKNQKRSLIKSDDNLSETFPQNTVHNCQSSIYPRQLPQAALFLYCTSLRECAWQIRNNSYQLRCIFHCTIQYYTTILYLFYNLLYFNV